jgi:aminobenzoyl-glutamate transport protein
MNQQLEKKESKSINRIEKILNAVEKAGNALPDPVTIFFIISVAVLIISWIAAKAGVSVIHPSTGESVRVVNLLTKEGLQKVFTNVVGNFQGYPPLGLVLVVMLGAGLAEKSGLIAAAMRHTITKIPPSMVSVAIILIGVIANAFGDAGLIVLPPLAALVFLMIGRHPLVGMYAAYAGVAGGFAANVMVNMSDVLAASFTIPAAQVIDPNYQGTPAMNLYFIMASVVFLVIAGAWVTENIIAPRFEKYEPDEELKEEIEATSENEIKGLKWAGIVFGLMLLLVVALSIGENAFMKDSSTGSILAYQAPLMQGIIPLITIIFFVPGVVYGKITGSIKNDKDVAKMMGESMKEMGPYIVLAFVASQFLAYFTWSNIGIVLSVKGAETLKAAGLTGIGLILGFIVISSLINIFVGSASAKWAIMAPIFVPMFMLLEFDPALTQMAYRIGDSITNPLTPLLPYFPILLGFAKKYDKNVGMGTMISNMLPYSVTFGIMWTIILIVFILLNLPLGPGGGIYYMIP